MKQRMITGVLSELLFLFTDIMQERNMFLTILFKNLLQSFKLYTFCDIQCETMKLVRILIDKKGASTSKVL